MTSAALMRTKGSSWSRHATRSANKVGSSETSLTTSPDLPIERRSPPFSFSRMSLIEQSLPDYGLSCGLLLLLRTGFARRWNDILQPHVGNHVAVVFIVMHVVESQHAQFRHFAAKELHHLSRGGVGHAVVSFIAIGKRFLQRLDQISLRSLGFLEAAGRWALLTQSGGTKRELGVGHMANELAEAANIVRGLESVIGFRHLIGGASDGVFGDPVFHFDGGAERTVLRQHAGRHRNKGNQKYAHGVFLP